MVRSTRRTESEFGRVRLRLGKFRHDSYLLRTSDLLPYTGCLVVQAL